MVDGFPSFPIKGTYVRFEKDWSFIQSNMSFASTHASATFSSTQTVPRGTIGQVLDATVIEGYDHDVAGGYSVVIGVIINDYPVLLKFPYTSRPDVIQVIPASPAARVLFGNNDGQT